jgi:hypothetical protein
MTFNIAEKRVAANEQVLQNWEFLKGEKYEEASRDYEEKNIIGHMIPEDLARETKKMFPTGVDTIAINMGQTKQGCAARTSKNSLWGRFKPVSNTYLQTFAKDVLSVISGGKSVCVVRGCGNEYEWKQALSSIWKNVDIR